jgi:hypothetical protein
MQKSSGDAMSCSEGEMYQTNIYVCGLYVSNYLNIDNPSNFRHAIDNQNIVKNNFLCIPIISFLDVCLSS